jgi:hypothetical protein
MAPATDAILARYQGEIEEKATLLETIVEDAERAGRDLNPQEMELIGRPAAAAGTADRRVTPADRTDRGPVQDRPRQ